MRDRSLALALSVSLLSCCGASSMAQPSAEDAALQGGSLVSTEAVPSVEVCWSNFLKAEGLQEGKNERGNYFVLVSHAKNPVGEAVGSRNWLTARNAMIGLAETQTRKALSESMSTLIQSDRSAAVRMFGGDSAPPSLKPAVEQLSLVEKTRVLADKAVDSEIKKYDNGWNGSGNRSDKVTATQVKIDQSISSSTELFASGAFTVAQCEGPSTEEDGKYSVLVGFIWSPVLQTVAESIWNPQIKVPPVSPAPPLSEQFAQFDQINPNWLAVTTGVRVFTNEKGQRVVVGFGAAPKTTLASADKDRARLLASGALQRFLGEKLVANSATKERFERRDYTDSSISSFDTSDFESRINLVSKEFNLVGATEVASWRGEHPWGKAGMQVVALAWSQAWAADSTAVKSIMDLTVRRMQGLGAVPELAKTPTRTFNGPAATKVSPGARSSTKDF